jgi:hypothetical protein
MQPEVSFYAQCALARARAHWRDPGGARGQTTTEWLMIAGLLTAVGIFLQGLMSFTLWRYAHQLVHGLRTIAP